MPTADEYRRLAQDLVDAFDRHDADALDRLNSHYARAFTFDDLGAELWRRSYSFRQRTSKSESRHLEPFEAQTVIAQDAGYRSWDALIRADESGEPPIPAFVVDVDANRIGPRRRLGEHEWDDLLAAMNERGVTGLSAGGMMTDAVLARVADLDRVTTLDLAGSREISDDGLKHLARMPQLEDLNVTGGRLTDRGLEVLRHLPNLRTFEMTWQRGITDAGIANLRSCARLERVNVMGSATGDGVIAALQGKAMLHQFSSGTRVTDAGLALLRNFPMLRPRSGADAGGSTNAVAAGRLLIDGPFTDAGLAALVDLEGLVDLDLFWNVTRITAAGFAHLRDVPNLAALGADDGLTSDAVMPHIAAIPRLRKLRAQGTPATDAGFEALSRSATLEQLWTRETPNLGDRGFVALSSMPALRTMGVSCRNVSDTALARLPLFPALRELTPIDVTDEGFRHVGRCDRLERLSCMYCRTTTDIATAYIAGLRLRSYYAGLTQITDRSLEILSGMTTLEKVEFYECRNITDAGLLALARLPGLREFDVTGSPGITLRGTAVFPSAVRVRYST